MSNENIIPPVQDAINDFDRKKAKEAEVSSIDQFKRELEDTPEKFRRLVKSGQDEQSGNEEEFEEKPAFKVEFEEGPEDVTKLDTFLLNVPEKDLHNKEAAEKFMKSTVEKENIHVDSLIDKARNEGDFEKLNALINQKYFLRTVERSLIEGDYKNKAESAVVDWFEAKRDFYQDRVDHGSAAHAPAFKDVKSKLETIGRTLILE